MFWLVFFCIIFFFSEQHLYYVFCLLKLDGQVLDTALVETDESETDISFDNIIVLYVFTLCLQDSTPACSLRTIFWKLKRCLIKLFQGSQSKAAPGDWSPLTLGFIAV